MEQNFVFGVEHVPPLLSQVGEDLGFMWQQQVVTIIESVLKLMLDTATEHQTGHGQVNHRPGDIGSVFAVAAQTPIAAQPTKGSLEHQSARQDDKLGHGIRAFDYFQNTPQGLQGSLDQLPGVAAVDPDEYDFSENSQCLCQEQSPAVAILYIGRQHHHHEQQVHRVDQDVAFAPLDLFPAS